MNRQQVQQVLNQLRAELPHTGRAEAILPGRTYLQLLHRNDTIQLLVAHPDHYPQLEDADEIARLAGVAEYTEARACTARIPGQDGRSIALRALAYSWRELPVEAHA